MLLVLDQTLRTMQPWSVNSSWKPRALRERRFIYLRASISTPKAKPGVWKLGFPRNECVASSDTRPSCCCDKAGWQETEWPQRDRIPSPSPNTTSAARGNSPSLRQATSVVNALFHPKDGRSQENLLGYFGCFLIFFLMHKRYSCYKIQGTASGSFASVAQNEPWLVGEETLCGQWAPLYRALAISTPFMWAEGVFRTLIVKHLPLVSDGGQRLYSFCHGHRAEWDAFLFGYDQCPYRK